MDKMEFDRGFVKKLAKLFGYWKNCITFAPAILKIANASLAQLVEHDTLNVGVQGSSPWGGTEREEREFFSFFLYPQGAMKNFRAHDSLLQVAQSS